MSSTNPPTHDDLNILLDLEADGGFLSVYLDADPAEQAASTPAWEIRLKNELAALETRQDIDHERLGAVLRLAEPHLADVIQPAYSGRARVLFQSVDIVRIYSFDLPLRTRAEFGPRPFVRPLLVALDRGAPFGILALTAASMRVLEWSMGATDEVSSADADRSGPPRERRGPAAANPARAQQGATHLESVEAHEDDHRRRFLSDAVAEVVALARGRSWSDIVVVGPQDMVAEATGALEDLVETPVHQLDAHLSGRDARKLGERAHLDIEGLRARRRAERVAATTGAIDNGRAVGGVLDTSRALVEGRVESLFFDDTAHPDGWLDDAGIVVASSDRGEHHHHHVNLIDHFAKLAVATSAEVVPLAATEATDLTSHAGVVARLRW